MIGCLIQYLHYYEICLLTDGLDYSVVNMGLTLSESLPRQCVDINITGDDVLEGNEIFIVKIDCQTGDYSS